MERAASTELKELVIERVFDSPREFIWRVWTEPERVKRWWGPKVFTAPVIKIDLRVGGEYLYCIRGPDGKDYWSKGTFKEIVAPERLVLTDSFADEEGNTVPATYYGMSPNFPLESLATVTFEKAPGNKTEFTLHYSGVPAEDFDNAMTGWNESFDKLAEYLRRRSLARIVAEPGKQDFTITREFDAPRNIVLKAFTDPELYTQWIGPHGFAMTIKSFEARSGSGWRYVQRDPAGNEYGFHGVFHEVLEPSRLIDTFEFEGLPETGHVSLETATFEELPGGRTKFTAHAVFQSLADRDGMMQSGMEWGVRDSYERLDELLGKLNEAARR